MHDDQCRYNDVAARAIENSLSFAAAAVDNEVGEPGNSQWQRFVKELSAIAQHTQPIFYTAHDVLRLLLRCRFRPVRRGDIGCVLAIQALAVLEEQPCFTREMLVRGYDYLSWRLLEMGQLEQAESALNRALELVSGWPALFINSQVRAWLVFRQGRLSQRFGEPRAALAFFKQAERLTGKGPRREYVRRQIARLLLELGRTEQARLYAPFWLPHRGGEEIEETII